MTLHYKLAKVNPDSNSEYYSLELKLDEIELISIGEEKGRAFSIHNIIDGVIGMIFALVHEHEEFNYLKFPSNQLMSYKPDKETGGEKEDIAPSFPLFEPSCSAGCCGFTDIGIKNSNDGIILTKFDNVTRSSTEYICDRNEYLDFIIYCRKWISDNQEYSRDSYYSIIDWALKKIIIEYDFQGREYLFKKLHYHLG